MSKLSSVTCYQSSRTGLRYCQTCGKHSEIIHIPILLAGYCCARCCPARRERSEAKGN